MGGKLLNAIKSFYRESRACVRVNRRESEWFDVKVGLRQGCVMSPWLFNIYMDGVVREVEVRARGKGAELSGEDGSRWEVSQLMFADDTALVSDTEEGLGGLVKEFGRVCERRLLRVNIGKSKVMKGSREGEKGNLNILLNGEKLEEVESFRYLGVDIRSDGSQGTEISHRVREGARVLGALKSIWSKRSVSREAKLGMFEGIMVPTVMYGSECWALNAREKKKVDVIEMKCLRAISGVRWFDRRTNESVRESFGERRRLLERAEQSELSWFGHVVRMDEGRLVKRIYEASVEGNRARGRPRRKWRDGVVSALGSRGLDVHEGERQARERRSWKQVVRMRGQWG